MLIIKTIGILLVIVISSAVFARNPNSVIMSPNMDKLCGQTILLNGNTLPGTYFSLTNKVYEENLNCILTIQGQTPSQRIIVVMDKMDISCGGDKILIYDGKRDQGLLLNKDQSLQCGTKKYYLRTSNSNTITIEFTSNNDGNVGYGFIMNVAINFPVNTCAQTDGLYRCRNHYCISNLFNCDDRNWCGDNTQKILCRRK